MQYEILIMVASVMESHYVYCKVKKWTSDEYVNEKLTLKRLWSLGAEAQSLASKCHVCDDLQFAVMEGWINCAKPWQM
jgi:hypothetical protein